VKKICTLFLVLLAAASLFAINVLSVDAAGIIFIKPDGTVEGTDKILRNGNVYSFTEDIEESYGIIVQAKNIVIDGNGHKIEGTYRILPVGSWDFGIELANDTGGNVTVKDLRILNFNIGIYVGTAGNTISGNVIKGGNVGITMAETPNTVVGNIIDENIEGVFLGPIPWNHTKVQNIFYFNSFLNNTRNVYDCECTNPIWIQHTNIWDNGTCGNYWANYTGIDSNNDKIGDTPHQVTEDDIDSYPLMAPLAVVPGGNGFLGTNLPLEAGVVITVAAAIVASAFIFVFRKRNKDP
jgi:nitrous oxidase accessory protein NosD